METAQIFNAAIGASALPHEMGEALIGFLEQSSRFLKPVYAGDTLYPEVVISALESPITGMRMRVSDAPVKASKNTLRLAPGTDS